MPTVDEVKDAIQIKGKFDTVARGMWKRFLIEKASAFEWDEPKRADGVPILARIKYGPQIVNHRLHSPFDRTIVNTKTAYFASNVAVIFEDTIPESVVDFYHKSSYTNAMDTVYEELATHAADSGSSFALMTKVGPDIAVVSVEPWQCLVKHDRFTKKPLYGVIYDEDTVRVYDGVNVTEYTIGKDSKGATYSRSSVKPHGFGTVSRPGIPLVEFPNNVNRIGNAVMTVSMQDAYDISLSDLSSEISQTRLAYLLMKGMGEDDDKLLKQMESSGIILVDDKDGDAKFVTKNLNPQAVQLLQKELRRLIFEGANSYDPASFAEGKTPPTAYEVNERLHPLEMDVQTTIKIWNQSLRYVDYLVQTFLMSWLREGEYELSGISRMFRRVAPRNTLGMLVEARQAGMVLSNGTKIDLSGLQVDPVEEALKIDKEGVIKKAAKMEAIREMADENEDDSSPSEDED